MFECDCLLYETMQLHLHCQLNPVEIISLINITVWFQLLSGTTLCYGFSLEKDEFLLGHYIYSHTVKPIIFACTSFHKFRDFGDKHIIIRTSALVQQEKNTKLEGTKIIS